MEKIFLRSVYRQHIIQTFTGTPAEVALIRMTADGRLPLNERRNYKNVFDALFRIYREEGTVTLYCCVNSCLRLIFA